jgi:hypothetical protein
MAKNWVIGSVESRVLIYADCRPTFPLRIIIYDTGDQKFYE